MKGGPRDVTGKSAARYAGWLGGFPTQANIGECVGRSCAAPLALGDLFHVTYRCRGGLMNSAALRL